MPLETSPRAGNIRELPEITVASDTRDYLAHAAKQALKYDDYELIVDMDAHLQEGGFWGEIIGLLENDVLKQTAEEMMRGRGGMPLINMQPGMSFQSMSGTSPARRRRPTTRPSPATASCRSSAAPWMRWAATIR